MIIMAGNYGINLTLFNETYKVKGYEITKSCMDWCREQHYIHNSNLATEGIFLLIFVFAAIIILYATYYLSDYYKNEKIAERVFEIALDAVILFMLAFFVWFFWFAPK